MSLGIPFLLASRMRSEASLEVYHRAQSRIAVESAASFSRLVQVGTHPSRDATPLWDDENEWNLSAQGPLPQSIPGWEAARESWGAQVSSMQSRISLASAPPMLLQNLLQPSYLAADVTFADRSFPISSTAGMAPSGAILVGRDWISYESISPTALNGVSMDPDRDSADEVRLREGTMVVSDTVLTLTTARLQSGGWTPPEFYDDIFEFKMGGVDLSLSEEDKKRLESLTWLETGAYGADAWAPAVWLARDTDLERPSLARVSDASAISAGTILKIEAENEAPFYTFALASFPTSNWIVLPSSLPETLTPWTTRIYPLRREPVDVNAASEEILTALMSGLRFSSSPVKTQATQGRVSQEWVTPSEARRVAQKILELRPFEGPDDFWRRLLGPMVEAGSLVTLDAWAIHLNGLDPNSGYLLQSTLPFGYRSGDRYLQRVDAAVRSRLGRTLARAARFLVTAISPTGPLLRLWETQEDFEDGGRWNRGLHGTVTLPANRGVLGGQHSSADGLTLRTGAWEITGTLISSKDAELSAVIPLPARDADPLNGHMEHFDLEPSPLGYDAKERGAYPTVLKDWGLGEGSGAQDVAPLHIQGWFRLDGAVSEGTLFDLVGDQTDRSRISAKVEEGVLIVQGWDNAGDDPFDPENTVQAQTVEVDLSEFSMADRWFHLSVLLRSISARGLQVAIDGVPRGDIDGLTWTTGLVTGHSPGASDSPIQVESTDGFPDRGVLRIGDEVIEYSSKSETSFITERPVHATGYLGGRAAREGSDAMTISLDTDHATGSAVELYGYSAPLVQDLPSGGSQLSGELGPFSVATGIDGEDPIQILLLNGNTFDLGFGIVGDYLGPLNVKAIPDAPNDPYYSETFQSTGGYALLAQRSIAQLDPGGFQIGGLEVVQYSSRSGDMIYLSERNIRTPSMVNWPDGQYASEGHSFITNWDPSIVNQDGLAFETIYENQLYVIPISVKGNGVSDLNYALPDGDFSEFVQITDSADAGNTEWVRYDSILENCFLRDDWAALNAAAFPILNDSYEEEWSPPLPPGGMQLLYQEPGIGDDFLLARTIGEPIEDRDQILEDIRIHFDFRGTMGTFDHAHMSSHELIPVLQTPYDFNPDMGYIGRGDRVALIQEASTMPPYWFEVQWGRAPHLDGRIRMNRWYSAFHTQPGVPFVASDLSNYGEISFDARQVTRVTKFPSGERPSDFHTFVMAGDLAGGGAAFGGMMDEVGINAPFGMGDFRSPMGRGSFQLEEDLDQSEVSSFRVDPSILYVDGHRYWSQSPGDWLQDISQSGLIDIDGERIAFQSVNTVTGDFSIAPNGRGLHGTQPRPHAAGTKVWKVDGRYTSVLSRDATQGDSMFMLNAQIDKLHADALLLVDEELLQVPILDGGSAGMPRYRSNAEDPDLLGDGILRGRFGTTPASHDQGTLVYSYPTRWLDRYVSESDSPAAAWFEVGLEEPEAYWRGILFDAEMTDASHRVMVLARTGEAQWEDDPDLTPGLSLIEDASLPGGLPVPLGFRADHLDLRVFFDWDVGAFDPIQFLSNGWTQAPRLRRLVVDYLAESRTDLEEDLFE